MTYRQREVVLNRLLSGEVQFPEKDKDDVDYASTTRYALAAYLQYWKIAHEAHPWFEFTEQYTKTFGKIMNDWFTSLTGT